MRIQLNDIQLNHLSIEGLHYTWAVFQLPNRDFGFCLADVITRVRWARIGAFNHEAERDLHKIQHAMWSDPRLGHEVRFDECSSERGEFIKVGLDTDAQSTLFKLSYFGANWLTH